MEKSVKGMLGRNMRRIRYSIYIGLCLLIIILTNTAFTVSAEESYNPDEVTIYALSDEYKDITGDIPTEYQRSYQINVGSLSGDVKYQVISGLINVSSDGLVTPKSTTWYWSGGFGSTFPVSNPDRIEVTYDTGDAVVRVTCGDYSQDITFHVIDYKDEYVEKKLDSIYAEVITDGMTDLEKLTAFAKWIGDNTDYSTRYSSAEGMMLYNAGDCWASTYTLLELCERAGVNAAYRQGNQDPGAGSGHENVVALCEGQYYVAEAGYAGNKPRRYSVDPLEGGFSTLPTIDGKYTIYQYDGFDTDVTIPETINGKTVVALGNGTASVFGGRRITGLHIPKTITTIDNNALSDAGSLTTLDVDKDNQYFDAVDGVLYTKDRTELIYTLKSKTELTIDPATTTINHYGIRGLNLDTLIIPGNVKTLEDKCLYETTANKLVIEDGLTTIKSNAFYGFNAENVEIPGTVTTLEEQAFYVSKIKRLTLSEGITTIPEQAFSSSRYLEELTLPSTITSIGTNAFTNCSKLENIYFNGTEDQWESLIGDVTLPTVTKVRTEAVRVTGIKQEESVDILLQESGEQLELGAEVIPENASNKDIVYTSDNTRIVGVDGNVIKAVGEGECTVTATTVDGGYTATYNVTVKYPKYKISVEDGCFYIDGVRKTEAEVYKGTSIGIRYLRGDDKTGLSFSEWDIDTEVEITSGSVSSTYFVFKMPAQDVNIKVKFDEIKIMRLYGISYDDYYYMCVGAEQKLSISHSPSEVYNDRMVWSSSDESIATVDEDGKLVAISPGEVTISATTTDGSNLTSSTTFSIRAHKFANKQVIDEATCLSSGKTKYTCSYCSTEKIEETPALGHDIVIDEAVEATCTESGLTEGEYCSRCGEVIVAQTVVSAKGHNYVETPGKEPTCTEEGYTAGKRCSICEDMIEGSTIPKTEHVIVIDPAVEATTSSYGLTEGKHCSECGTVLVAQQIVPKKQAESGGGQSSSGSSSSSASSGSSASARSTAKTQSPKYSNEWVNGKWYGADGRSTYSGKLSWKSNAKGWWVEDTAGWYPTSSWQKIDGVWYYFKPNGYMASEEYYNGYWFNKNGSWDSRYKLSWKQNSTGWWVEDVSGWWPSSSWLKIDGDWYYFDGSGYMVTSQYVGGWWIGADGVCR